jgi:hypothetical protein
MALAGESLRSSAGESVEFPTSVQDVVAMFVSPEFCRINRSNPYRRFADTTRISIAEFQRALLRETLRQPGPSLARVLAVLEAEFLRG